MDQIVVKGRERNAPDDRIDWRRLAYMLHLSRALDEMEESRLVPETKVLYQCSARGHDMAQILLGMQLTGAHDATCGYYRSRPLLLSLGVDPADALGSAMGRAGGSGRKTACSSCSKRSRRLRPSLTMGRSFASSNNLATAALSSSKE